MPVLLTDLDADAFKHIIVPLGIVIGLGVAHILAALSRYFEHHDRVTFSLAHGIWAAISFLLFVAFWWNLWDLRHIPGERWTLLLLIFLMIGPSLMYISVSLLLPNVPNEGELDLGQRFDRVGRSVFLCTAGAITWLAVTEVVMEEQTLWAWHRLSQCVAILSLLVGAVRPTRGRAVILGFIVLVLGIIVNFVATRGLLR